MAQRLTTRVRVDGGSRSRPVAPGDDALLVAALQEGSEAAFVVLVDRHRTAMLRVARFYVRSESTAEDVVQDTWLAVLRGIDRFDGRSTLKTWMYKILTNRAKTAALREDRFIAVDDMAEREVRHTGPAISIEHFRREGMPWTGHWTRSPQPWPRLPDDDALTSEAVALVRAAIAELPPVQRLVISLRDVHCWSAQEVCDVLGLTDSNQRVLLHRARCKVRSGLASYLVGDEET